MVIYYHIEKVYYICKIVTIKSNFAILQKILEAFA